MTFNPYEAPTQEAHHRGLSPDTEFLVSGNCILCGDQITLPPVCVATGQTDDLLQKTVRLKWQPRWLWGLCIFFTMLALNISFSLLFETVLHLALAAFVWASVVLTGIGLWRWTYRVQATWCVARTVAAKERRRRNFWIAIGIGCFCLAAISIGLGLFRDDLYLAGTFVTGLFGLSALSRIARKVGPQFAGRYEGLNVLLRLSPAFLEEINRMIQRQAD